MANKHPSVVLGATLVCVGGPSLLISKRAAVLNSLVLQVAMVHYKCPSAKLVYLCHCGRTSNIFTTQSNTDVQAC